MTQFIQLNGWQLDEYGIPQMVNKMGDLDVDIVLDEGPDTINQQADAFDTLEVLASRDAEIPPEILLELSALPVSVKQRLLKKLDPPPSEEKKQAMQLELEGKKAEVDVDKSSAALKEAQAYKTYLEANNPEEAQGTLELGEPPELTAAQVAEKQASAAAKQAQAQATMAKVGMDRQQMMGDQQMQAQKTQAEIQQMNANTRTTQTDTDMRPYQEQNEQYKQGMDFALKKEQIKNKPQGGGQ